MEDVPGGMADPPPKSQPNRMQQIVILGSFSLVGEVGVAAHPAHLEEDMPGGEADPPTKFDPCIVILGSFLLVGALRPRPPRPPSGRCARGQV